MKEQQKETSAKMVTLNKFAPKDSQTKTDGMYDPAFEHDNCGIGSVVNIKGIKTHETVENALKIVENLKHRAGKDAEGKTGDGVGILLQISHCCNKKRHSNNPMIDWVSKRLCFMNYFIFLVF